MADIILKDRNGNDVTYEGVTAVKVNTEDGGSQIFSKGEAVEKSVVLDFSNGDMTVAENGTLFSSVTIPIPESLVAENIAKGATVAGVEGSYEGSGTGKVDYINDNATATYKCQYEMLNGVRSMTFTGMKSIYSNTFQFCEDLEKLDFYKLTSIGMLAFSGCMKLTALIIRTETMCQITDSANLQYMFKPMFGSNPPIHSGGTGYIYVPSSLVATYQADSNWSSWATQFRAIEDYHDICG